MSSPDTDLSLAMGARLPSDGEFAEMFETLLGVSVTAQPVAGSTASTSAYALSLHVDPAGELVGAVGADITFTANTAVAIAGQLAKNADDVIHKGVIGLDLWDNFREVANVMNVLFTSDRHSRVILHSAQRVELPLWSRLQHAHATSISFTVEIAGFATSNVSIFSFTGAEDPELVEALLVAGAEAAAHDMQVVGGKLLRLYDFHRPKGVERSQLNALRTNLSIFTKGAAAAMTELLQSPVHIKLVQLHHQNWDDYAGTLDNNAFITTYKLDPLPSQFVVTFSPGLSMKCLDCRLSGPDQPGSLRHSLTDLDVALLAPIVKAVVNELALRFSAFVPVRGHVVRHVTEKFMMEGVTLSLTWLVAWMTVTVAGSTFDASLCFPIVPLQPVLLAMADAASRGDHQSSGDGDESLFGNILQEVEVNLTAHFAPIHLTIDRIANLEPGTVLPLGVDPSASLILSAKGRPLATIDPVVVGRRLAATVRQLIEDPEEFFADWV